MTENNKQSFSNDKIALLSRFFSSGRAGEEPLDYISTHGFLTALAICPEKISSTEWLPALFDGIPDYQDDTEAQTILSLLRELIESQEKALESDALIEFPFTSNGDHEAELQNWCIGFVEAFFIKEEAWFSNKEESIIAELTLPVMALSGLFEEQLEELIEDEEQYESLLEQLPETLTDLYLLYRSPPEK